MSAENEMEKERRAHATRGEWVSLPDRMVPAINEQLEARGWRVEYDCDSYIGFVRENRQQMFTISGVT